MKGKNVKTFKKLRIKQTWDEYNSIFSRINRYSSDYQGVPVEERGIKKEFKPLYKIKILQIQTRIKLFVETRIETRGHC